MCMAAKDQILDPAVLELIASRFRVLGEPLRLRILQILDREKEMSVSLLAEEVESTQPNVSKHLNILQKAGLVGRRKEGNTVYCRVTDPTVFELCDVVCGSLYDRLKEQADIVKSLGRTRS